MLPSWSLEGKNKLLEILELGLNLDWTTRDYVFIHSSLKWLLCAKEWNIVTALGQSRSVLRMGVEKDGVMVNCMYQFDWVTGYPDIWLNLISGCVCECFQMRLT